MRAISGLIRPTRGAISMEGVDLLATPAHRIVELGIAHVPENRRLFARMNVEDGSSADGQPSSPPPGRNSPPASTSSTASSRASRSGAINSPAPSRAASSRCARSAARWDVGAAVLLLLDEPSAGLRAGRRPAGLRAGRAHPRERAHGADRRAECAPGIAGRRPRLTCSKPARSAPAAPLPNCSTARRSMPPIWECEDFALIPCCHTGAGRCVQWLGDGF